MTISLDDRELRIHYVENLILKRWPRREIKKVWKDKYKMSDQTFGKDYREAIFNIKDDISNDREQRFSLAIASREDIIKQAKEGMRLDIAARVEKDLAELEGLYKGSEGGDVKVVFDFGSLPAAESMDGPVGKEKIEEYKKQTEGSDQD